MLHNELKGNLCYKARPCVKKEERRGCWIDGSKVKSTDCSSRVVEFGFFLESSSSRSEKLERRYGVGN